MIHTSYNSIDRHANETSGLVLWQFSSTKRTYYTRDFDLAKSFELRFDGEFEYYGYGYLITI